MAVEIRMPKYPECWATCGQCAAGEVFVLDVLVKPGDRLEADDNIITIETGKVALDIPSPWSGTVEEVFVTVGDTPAEGAVLITLNRDHA